MTRLGVGPVKSNFNYPLPSSYIEVVAFHQRAMPPLLLPNCFAIRYFELSPHCFFIIVRLLRFLRGLTLHAFALLVLSTNTIEHQGINKDMSGILSQSKGGPSSAESGGMGEAQTGKRCVQFYLGGDLSCVYTVSVHTTN